MTRKAVTPMDELTEPDHFTRALSDVCSPFEAFRPPNRVPVSRGAAETLRIAQPGLAPSPWSADETPYMVEPMDMLASRRHEAVAFIGPARTGKTMGLLDGWMAHVVVNDPGDMLIVQMTQDKAREFSKARIDRALMNSPKLQAIMGASKQDDNTHDKKFRHGMWLRIAWPTVPNLSSTEYRYVGFTDYDRIPDDIDGEGSGYSLGLKRTTTFLSRGMCMVETSPGRPVTDPGWKPATAHEAPPVGGGLGIYNNSDRRRWYWKCPHCADWFEAAPGLGLFHLPPDEKLLDIVREADLDALASQYNRIICPNSGCIIEPKHKTAMNLRGRWLADGQRLTSDDRVVGSSMTSTIAGYWLGGVAAAYQSWRSLVMRHLQGLRAYALTGSELSLQATVNTDQGMPYTSMHLREATRQGASPEDRTEVGLARYMVPAEARFLVAMVDVQGGVRAGFVVQVHAVGPHREQWLVDRYHIADSNREGMGGPAPIDPAAYAEDWDVLTDRVLRATYRTPIEGQELRVKMVAVDSGGEDGVTERAYAWFRRVRREGEHHRIMLVKGASHEKATEQKTKNPVAPIRLSWVGGRTSKEKGDIPLYVLNTNALKDMVATGLKRPTPGPGYFHFPAPKSPANPDGWLHRAFFDELESEVRGVDGVWKQVRKRNESFDLCVYSVAVYLRLGADKIANWDRPPKWAAPMAENAELVTVEDRRAMQDSEPIEDGPVERLAVLTAPPPRVVKRRPVARSSYLAR